MTSTKHPAKSKRPAHLDKNNPREVFGWKMYDWANSAFSTTIVSALFGPYLTEITQRAVGENGTVLSLGPMGAITAKSFFPTCVSAAVFLQIFLLPILGSVADYSNLKKKMMALFCYIAVAATCLMFFVTGGLYWLGGLLFIIANLGFGAAVVFYNGFLNDITTEDQRDKVSSRGFAYGYLGGGLFACSEFPAGEECATIGNGHLDGRAHLTIVSGVWWGGFALITFATLKTRAVERSLPRGKTYLTVGFSELGRTFRELARLRHTLKYLIGYLFFNDGIQTVISMASVFMAQELFIARGLKTDQSFLLGIFLMVQFVAIFGALLFERLAYAIKTKNAILISLVLWAGVSFMDTGFLRNDDRGVDHGRRHCHSARRLASAFAVAFLPNDSSRKRSFLFWNLRGLRAWYFVDGAAGFWRCGCGDEFLSAGFAVANSILCRGHYYSLPHRHRQSDS